MLRGLSWGGYEAQPPRCPSEQEHALARGLGIKQPIRFGRLIQCVALGLSRHVR
jgi:hypothetical protein